MNRETKNIIRATVAGVALLTGVAFGLSALSDDTSNCETVTVTNGTGVTKDGTLIVNGVATDGRAVIKLSSNLVSVCE